MLLPSSSSDRGGAARGEVLEVPHLVMGLAGLETRLGERAGEAEAFQFGLEYGDVRMDFRHLLVEVAEAKDIGEDPPVVEVGDGVAEGEEEGGGSSE